MIKYLIITTALIFSGCQTAEFSKKITDKSQQIKVFYVLTWMESEIVFDDKNKMLDYIKQYGQYHTYSIEKITVNQHNTKIEKYEK